MKLLELFNSTVPLLEQSFNYRLVGRGGYNTVAYYGNRNDKIPSLMVMSMDNKPLAESDNFVVITVKPRIAFKKAQEKDKRNGVAYSPLSAQTALINYANSEVEPQSLQYMSIHSDIFNIKEINGRGRMFVYMTTTLGMSVGMFERNLGEVPEIDEGYIDVYGARLFFPENMRPKRKEGFVDLFRQLHKMFYAHSFINLIAGDVRFVKLTGNTLGLYYLATNDIRIKPTAQANNRLLFTMIHEHGHRYWYQFSSEEARKTVRETFTQLQKGGENYVNPNEDSIKQRQQDFYDQIEIGSTVNYKGRKGAFKRHTPMTVKNKEGGNLYLKSGIRDIVAASGSAAAFMNNQWDFEGVEIQPVEDHELHTYGQDSEQWFPTQYSMQDPEEWFAELFALYIMDNLHGKPKAFLETVIRS